MATDIGMASNALLLLGDDPISSFNDAGKGAQTAAAFYPETYKAVLSEYPWPFALKEQELSLLSQKPDPLVSFTNAFQLPTDMIRLWRVFPRQNYELINDLLYTNAPKVLARYIHKVSEVQLPPHFVKAMEYKLASDFAISVTEDQGRMDRYFNLYINQVAKAMSIESQGKPQQPIQDSPFVDVRHGGFSRSGF